MYEASFGLGRAPFRLLPDPRFYLDGGQYGKLLAQLIAGLEAGEPYMLLTGPSGSGKTAAVQRLLMMLARTRWTVGAMFASADAAGADVLHAVAYAFNLARADTQPEAAFDAWLSSQTARGSRVLLVIDEAEHLDEGALRELARRLAPAKGSPGLQFCLVGEQAPAALAGAVRDGFLPPVAVHCQLRALDANETRDYVLHRLRCAGWKGRPAFDRAATDAIHRRSEGIPRRIHLIADRVLLQLSLDDADVATAAAVEIADDQRTVELQGRAPPDALPADVAARPRPGPPVAKQPYGHKAAPQRIEPTGPIGPLPPPAPTLPPVPPVRNMPSGPPVPPGAPPPPQPPVRVVPEEPRADAPMAASAPSPGGESPRASERALPGGTEFAEAASAAMKGAPPQQAVAPRGAASHVRKAAAGAMVLALAGIGIAWWLGVGRAVEPPALARNAEIDSARPNVAAPAPPLTGEAAAPAAGPAAAPAADPAPPAAEPAPIAQATPAASAVTAGPEPVAAPSPPSATTETAGTAPPPSTAAAAATAAATSGTAEPLPAPQTRAEPGRATSPSAGPARAAVPSGGPSREARRAAGSGPGAPLPSTSTATLTPPSPTSPTPASCTATAAALGLCEPAAASNQPAPPPARMAVPSAQAPAAPAAPAPPAAPCEPSRAALGLCER